MFRLIYNLIISNITLKFKRIRIYVFKRKLENLLIEYGKNKSDQIFAEILELREKFEKIIRDDLSWCDNNLNKL